MDSTSRDENLLYHHYPATGSNSLAASVVDNSNGTHTFWLVCNAALQHEQMAHLLCIFGPGVSESTEQRVPKLNGGRMTVHKHS